MKDEYSEFIKHLEDENILREEEYPETEEYEAGPRDWHDETGFQRGHYS